MHPNAIITVLTIGGTVVAMMQTLVLPLLPAIPGVLGVSTEDASWLITATAISSAVCLPTFGRLADMYGKRRVILLAIGIVAVGSIVATFATSLPLLIVGRTLQGAGIPLISISISLMRDELPAARLPAAVALMSATMGVGMAIGLPLSGVVYGALGMHALFATTAITSAVLIVAVLIVVPESPLRTGGRFDVTGAVILASVLVGLLLAITKGQDWGWTSLRTLGCVAASLALLALWIPLQLRGSAPLVDLRSTRRKPVALAHVCSFLVGLVFFANLLSSTMLLEQPVATGYGLGMTASQTGLLLIPAALSMALMAPVAGMIVRRFGPRTALITSTVALTVAYLARSVMLDSAIQVVIATMAVTMTVVVGYSALPILIMTSVPPSETAVANSVNALARSIASAVASATVAAIVVSITIEVDGHTYPSENAFHLLFLGAAAFGMLATVAAVALPHRHRRSA